MESDQFGELIYKKEYRATEEVGVTQYLHHQGTDAQRKAFFQNRCPTCSFYVGGQINPPLGKCSVFQSTGDVFFSGSFDEMLQSGLCRDDIILAAR